MRPQNGRGTITTPTITAPPQRRWISTSPPSRSILSNLIASRVATPYAILKGTERIYEACAAPARYTISEHHRNQNELDTTDEGEEIGVEAGCGAWHGTLGLLPTFSTWSQVTMLHMYIVLARIRCCEVELARRLEHQLTDAFFWDCEKVMDVNHGMRSASLRQRYLRDLFVQWRGLVLSHDEGLVRGDAALAAALWRNLLRARAGGADDVTRLAGLVAWVRASVQDVASMDEVDLLTSTGIAGGAGGGADASVRLFRRDLRACVRMVSDMVRGDGPAGQAQTGQPAR